MGIYLDHAATTYVDKKVLGKMMQCYSETFGNTSSQHGYGRDADKCITAARAQVAAAIGASPVEIFFTSGGTESDNWAIKGVAKFHGKGHIITSSIEHQAVLDTCKYLETKGFSVAYLPVNEFGRVSPSDVQNALQSDTILISIMFANNEVGTIMPMAQIGEIAKKHSVPFHTDAVQAVGHVAIDVAALGIDLLSLSAHKFYGPKGAGALYIKKGTDIVKLIHGGSHERGMRAGTLNSPGIVGLGEAISLAVEIMDKEYEKESALAKRLKEGLLALPKTKYNGHPIERLPGNVNISFEGIEAEALMLHLDLLDIAVSTGSACSSGSNSPSYVLKEMGCSIEQARAAVRFTIGRRNTAKEIDTVIKKTKGIVENLRALSPLFADKGEN